MRSRATAIAAVVALLAVACGTDDPAGTGSEAAPPAEGAADSTELLAFTSDTIGGGSFDASSLDGAPAVLWFWAPWCVSCRVEAPEVARAAGEYAGRVDVVGVAGRGEVPAMEAFVDETGTGELTHLVDGDGSIWSGFGVFGQPAFAFISADGDVDVVVGTLGGSALRDRMDSLVAS